MWKWIAISSLLALVVQAGFPLRSAAIAKDQLPDTSGPLRIADAAMQRVKEQDLHGAMAIVQESESKNLPTEIVATQIDNAVRQMSKQRDLIEGLGQPLGEVEFLGREVIGKSYVVFNYLEKFERRALAWRVTFYSVKNEWGIASFEWNQDLRPFVRPDSTELNDPR